MLRLHAAVSKRASVCVHALMRDAAHILDVLGQEYQNLDPIEPEPGSKCDYHGCT